MEHRVLLENGLFQAHTDFGSVPEQQARVRALIAAAAQSERPLVLHLHGGLVKREGGIALAQRLAPVYAGAGALPLFFVWQSGFLETICSNYEEALDGRFSRWAVKKLVGWLRAKLSAADEEALSRSTGTIGERSPAADPAALRVEAWEEQEWRRELETDAEFDQVSRALVQAVQGEFASEGVPDQQRFRALLDAPQPSDESARKEASALRPELFVAPGQEVGTRGLIDLAGFQARAIKALIEALVRALARYLKGTQHGLHATAVEEFARGLYGDAIGSRIWGFMKQDAEDAFQEGDARAGSFLLQALAAAPQMPRVVVVAHSAGSLFACHLLRKASRGRFDLLFLAPAVTYELFDATLASSAGRIGDFRMFAMLDEHERRDALVQRLPYLYPCSLLYLVSGLFECDAAGKADVDKPLLGMERYLAPGYAGRPQDRAMIARVKAFLDGGQERVIWSVADQGLGLCSKADSHGGFDEEPHTLESIGHIIGKGYALA